MEEVLKMYKEMVSVIFGVVNPKITKIPEAFLENTKSWGSRNYWNYLLFVLRGVEDRNQLPVFLRVFNESNFDLWLKRDKSEDYSLRKFAERFVLQPPSVFTTVLLGNEYFLNKRLESYNTPKGFFNCKTYGNLYREDKICLKCKYKNFCSVSN